jgi:hypothetical protein
MAINCINSSFHGSLQKKKTQYKFKNLNPLVTNIAIKVIPLDINLVDYFRVTAPSYA